MITGGLFDEFEQVSYSKVTDHPDANTSGYEPGMLWGIWDYQERDIEDTEGESFYSVGTFTIDRKGNFTYESYNGETIEGTITIDYDYYEMQENYRNASQITEYCNTRFNMNMQSVNLKGKEVCTYSKSDMDLQNLLNEMSMNGWELYSMQETENDEGQLLCHCIFMKETDDRLSNHC